MRQIETKADMVRDFHVTMGVICAKCKHSEPCNKTLVWCCRTKYEIARDKDGYCQHWEEK